MGPEAQLAHPLTAVVTALLFDAGSPCWWTASITPRTSLGVNATNSTSRMLITEMTFALPERLQPLHGLQAHEQMHRGV